MTETTDEAQQPKQIICTLNEIHDKDFETLKLDEVTEQCSDHASDDDEEDVSMGSPPSPTHTLSSSEEDNALGSSSDSQPRNSKKTATKQKLKPNLRRDQIVVAKSLKHNSFLTTDLDCLPDVPRPVLPPLSGKLTHHKLHTIQEFISSFEYNFLPEFFFNINKHRPLYQIMDTCTEIIRDALPLRCVEGTFLAIFATQQFENILRYPVSFRSCVGNTSYKHIVLIVQNGNKFGALGLSRKSSLMYKQLKYTSLSSILHNFWKCYQKIGHTMLGFTVGLPIPNNSHCKDVVLWEFLQFSMKKHDWETQIAPLLNQYSKESQKVNEEFRQACKLSTKTKRTYHGFLVPKYNKRIQAQLDKDAQASKPNQRVAAEKDTRPKSVDRRRSAAEDKKSGSTKQTKIAPPSAKKNVAKSAPQGNAPPVKHSPSDDEEQQTDIML